LLQFNQNQKEFSRRQVHIPENVSMTLLKITDRHHNYPQRGWGKWDQENGSKNRPTINQESIRKRKKSFGGK